MTESQKRKRKFSEAFKKEKVSQIDSKKITVRQICLIYEVSDTAVYKWIKKYSKNIPKDERIVVEKESEGQKNIELLKKIAEVERLLGQKETEIAYLKKVIEFGSDLTGTNIKKKYESQS